MEERPKTHILVVDDDKLVLDLHCQMLKRLGYATTAAEDGMEALQKLTCGDRFDLVLTDINLPFISGWELAKRVREFDHSMPIVAVTGECPDSVISQVNDSGVAYVLFKPLRLTPLRDVLSYLLNPADDMGPHSFAAQ